MKQPENGYCCVFQFNNNPSWCKYEFWVLVFFSTHSAPTTLAWKEYHIENYVQSLTHFFLLWSGIQVSSTQWNFWGQHWTHPLIIVIKLIGNIKKDCWVSNGIKNSPIHFTKHYEYTEYSLLLPLFHHAHQSRVSAILTLLKTADKSLEWPFGHIPWPGLTCHILGSSNSFNICNHPLY